MKAVLAGDCMVEHAGGGVHSWRNENSVKMPGVEQEAENLSIYPSTNSG